MSIVMASSTPSTEMSERLKIKKFSGQEATAAIEGERIPEALGLPLLRICTVRGIRHNDGFGHELRGVSAEFTRALNAREIMSNRIPNIDNIDEETPYCIWHPELASEETYRQLAKKYPHMSYQVGRACAVAGYTELYLELGILPEVHVAEDARESGNMAIYEAIMSKPVKYNVMNDYDRTIDSNNPKIGCLNGDTAVCASLVDTQGFTHADAPEICDDGEDFEGLFHSDGFESNTFNITEDMNIAAVYKELSGEVTSDDIAHSNVLLDLLTNPLPPDLPTIDKDMLIYMAAYNGDIDRYSRLRRPKMVGCELICCIRGIYHNTMFAVWWSKQQMPEWGGAGIQQAISARFIMNNCLSKVGPEAYKLPYLIWYPNTASPTTYRKLAQMAPSMLPQILRACIYANYIDLFDELVTKIRPDEPIFKEAEISPNRHYHEVLTARVERVGKEQISNVEDWKLNTHRRLDVSRTEFWKTVAHSGPTAVSHLIFDGSHCLYNGFRCDFGNLELLASLPDRWRMSVEDDFTYRTLDYIEHPAEFREK